MDIVEKLRRQAASDEAAGTLYSHTVDAEAADEIERLRAEVEEQCRLLGMSGSREAKLLADISRLEAAPQCGRCGKRKPAEIHTCTPTEWARKMEEESAELRKDAERYQWIRSLFEADELDAAIDAAIKGEV